MINELPARDPDTQLQELLVRFLNLVTYLSIGERAYFLSFQRCSPL